MLLIKSIGNPFLVQIGSKLLERFLHVLLFGGREELVHQEKLEGAVAVHSYVLFSQFWKRKLRVS